MGYVIYHKALEPELLQRLDFVVPWLASKSKQPRWTLACRPEELPSAGLQAIYRAIMKLLPEQQFNSCLLTDMRKGSRKGSERLSELFTGRLVIAPAGDYLGGSLMIDGDDVKLHPGDVLSINTVGGTYRPRLGVGRIRHGRRWSVTLAHLRGTP